MTALDLRGKRIWKTGTSGRSFGRVGRVYSTPAVKFGRVYLGSLDGRVYSFVARNGKLAWSHSTGGYVYASPAVARVAGHRPTVYIGSYDGNFYALDARNGKERWKLQRGRQDLRARRRSSARSSTSRTWPPRRPAASTCATASASSSTRRGSFTPVISDGKRLYLTGYTTLYGFVPKDSPEARPKKRKSKRRE